MALIYATMGTAKIKDRRLPQKLRDDSINSELMNFFVNLKLYFYARIMTE